MALPTYRIEQTARGFFSLLLLVPLFLLVQLVVAPLVAIAQHLIDNILEAYLRK